MSPLLQIIPPRHRRRSLGVVLAVLLRGVLNFAGLAVMLPVLMLILDTGSIPTAPVLGELYRAGGFASQSSFTVAVCAGVLVLLLLKSAALAALIRVQRRYFTSLYEHFSRTMLAAYRSRGLGLIKRSNSAVLARNVNFVTFNLVMYVLQPAASMLSEAILLVLLFGALCIYNPAVSLLALVVFGLSSLLYLRIVRGRLQRYGEQENRARRQQARTVTEFFHGYSDIEIAGAFPAIMRRFEESLHTIARLKGRTDLIAAVPSMLTEGAVALALVGLVLWHLERPQGEQVQLLFGVFAVAALRILPSVRNIMSYWWQIRYNRYTIPIVHEACAQRPEPVVQDAARLPFAERIEVRSLGFRYDDAPAHEWVLRDLSFTVARGERIGFRGASGAGKSTLFNLLLGLYTPCCGEIRIDGTLLTPALRRAWQNNVGYVSQQVYIEDSTLARNVALGEEESCIDRKKVVRVLEVAQLGHLIASLPAGIDTPIGECGNRLSGGQRQRIAIARALYRDASVLLFDEATSALDEATEQQINRSIGSLSRDLTILVIAHRERSLEGCDRIIEIEKHDL